MPSQDAPAAMMASPQAIWSDAASNTRMAVGGMLSANAVASNCRKPKGFSRSKRQHQKDDINLAYHDDVRVNIKSTLDDSFQFIEKYHVFHMKNAAAFKSMAALAGVVF